MQFAGGMPIARLADEWGMDAAWVEDSVRLALLATIPRRSGGLKATRKEMQEARSEEQRELRAAQGTLGW